MKCSVIGFALAILSFAPPAALAQGGPPLRTDDPATPGNRHWEINAGFTVESCRTAGLFETPRIDFNYGLGDHIQLKYEIPWVVLDPNGDSTKSGLGNSLLGVKWRFVDEEQHGIAVSMYPQLEFNNPTASADRGLAERGAQFLLPLEMARRVGPVKVNGEFGYKFVQHRSDELLYGLALGHEHSKRLELLGEIHGTAQRGFAEDELVFDLGGRFRLDKTLVLLVSAGRSLRQPSGGNPAFIAYLGMQFNF